ncbi:DEAD/DEAH box helicase [Limosilactobacillus fastidiosus]|uniref:DEAD/DEAH box helicase n=1 Tax=Limosilactobacillus fastidiosus TaxID=2759855 RepID=A0A7W3YBU1_9LACO|nr:DEAD/DEAH box helicase [Limosilactobacillus fastidiosus]MBB1085500.1 DEAD/DEAH box helicase [Limosilactobacillus fastidiosus]MCD7085953.1 DEAD/DEAH box helicase [Limosilactobacillus fastidiosus]MCD7114403.1 DEAD/DEAH box helicase [Limosilactobacillus fastidiosus]MCD7116410.1 DEAD/DEAH box helicase [Limosilactobacillus fastidiosus]
MDVFSRYAPFIQDYIYNQGWRSLRAIQQAAGEVIFNGDQNVLLSAPTASGKTEAAFFPILTMMSEEPPASVGCLYIAPLKALINDQYQRLNELCREPGIPVWRWHGDVAQSQKRKLLRHPSGVLQITPESLESLMINKHMDIPRLFGDLRFIVIDEIHSMLRGDRGGQTFCLIERLAKLAGCHPRRIGLSATIGDPKAADQLLAAGTGKGTVIPKIADTHEVWRLSMEHFYKDPIQAGDDAQERDAQPVLDKATDKAPTMADPGLAYVFEHTRGKKCLVFTNSREECEAVCQSLRAYCEANHEPDRFMIHHGNLSTAFRQTAEEAMRDDNSLMTTCATATLELGIDIGRLERAFQIDAPFTVSGFLQRMGRTGRRGDPPEMWFVMREEHPESRAMLPELIPWPLIQGIALVQLYLEERFVEPPRTGRLPYSLLYHQTMSTLASSGEMTPAELASRILTLSYFHNINQDDYRILLRHLIEIDHIQQTENGGLIIGLSGERVVNNFKFYAVFQENEEFSVHSGSEELGTIVKPPPVGDKIAIAGRVWVVEDIDRQRHQVYCHEVKGRIPAYFGDVAGDIHPRILERMQQVLVEDKKYPYLMVNASARLREARETARAAGMLKKSLINLGGKMWCFFPWTGTYSFLALERLLRLKCAQRLGLRGFNSVRPYYMEFSMDASEEEFYQIIKEEAAKDFDPVDLVFENEVPVFDKYDQYIPDELIRKGFAQGVLDIKEMRRCVRRLVRQYNKDRK